MREREHIKIYLYGVIWKIEDTLKYFSLGYIDK